MRKIIRNHSSKYRISLLQDFVRRRKSGQDAMHEWGVIDCISDSDKQTLYSLVRVPIFTAGLWDYPFCGISKDYKLWATPADERFFCHSTSCTGSMNTTTLQDDMHVTGYKWHFRSQLTHWQHLPVHTYMKHLSQRVGPLLSCLSPSIHCGGAFN